MRALWELSRRWVPRLLEFGGVQILVQGMNAFAGLLIVRSLSKSDYTLFAIVNSMQTTGSLLSDLGVGLGLQSIGGRVWNDPEKFNSLLATARRLRVRFALMSLGVTVPFATWILLRNGATLSLIVGLVICIVAGLVPAISSAIFTVGLQLQGEYRRIQSYSLVNAGLRLLLIGGLALSKINAFAASFVGVIGNWVQLFQMRRWALQLWNLSAIPNDADHRELLRLSFKWMPNVIFFCLQGQITLSILTFSGNSTGIADATALGRIAALFASFAAVFTNVICPRFTRCQDAARLPRLYLLLVGGALLTLLPALLIARYWAKPFVWLLGAKYAGMEKECFWVVAAVCVSQLCGVLWSLNSSKAWIRMQSVAFIPAIVGAQFLAVAWLDLRQFHDVLVFNLLTAAAPLPVYIVDAYWGLRPSPHLTKQTV